MSEVVSLRSFLDSAFGNLTLSDIIEADMMVAISERLTKKRVEMGLSQKEFAKMLGISQGMLSRYEKGANNFSVKTLAKVFGELGIHISLDFSEKEKSETKFDFPNMGWGNIPDYIGRVDKSA